MEAEQHLIDILQENDFPYLYIPYVDTETKAWHDTCQSKKMFRELGEMGISFYEDGKK
jgi:hypothetical protein